TSRATVPGRHGYGPRAARRPAPAHAWHVWLVRQQNDRRVVGDFPKCRGEIIDADTPDRPEAARRKIGQLVAEPGEPERPARALQPRHIVFINRNAGSFERAARDRWSLPVALHALVV